MVRYVYSSYLYRIVMFFMCYVKGSGCHKPKPAWCHILGLSMPVLFFLTVISSFLEAFLKPKFFMIGICSTCTPKFGTSGKLSSMWDFGALPLSNGTMDEAFWCALRELLLVGRPTMWSMPLPFSKLGSPTSKIIS